MIEFNAVADFDLQMFNYYVNTIPSIFPFLAMFSALYFSLKLFVKLKPGMVCELEDSCFRCHLLYGMSIGTFVFSIIYIISELLRFASTSLLLSHTHTFDCLTIMITRAGLFAFLAWINSKGFACLESNCLYKQRVFVDEKSKKSRSIISGDSPACMCYPIGEEGFAESKCKLHGKQDRGNEKEKKSRAVFFTRNRHERGISCDLKTTTESYKH